jgi:hypothetical protein
MGELDEASSVEAEVVDLGPVDPPARGPRPRTVFAGVVVVLLGLIGVAGLPAGGLGPEAPSGPTSGAPRSSAPGVVAHPTPDVTTPPWGWTTLEIAGYGRGSTVEHLWVLGDVFVAEVKTDEGPDGGPSGPLSSVLLTSTDGFEWTQAELPAVGFVVAAGTVANGRLWVVGHVLTADPPRWQLWSTDDGTWRHEADPAGLVDGEGTVTALAYRSECLPDEDCRAAGWVAATRSSGLSRPDELRISKDGRRWTIVDIPDEPSLSVFGIVEHAGLWVVAGARLRDGRDAGVTVALTSTDRQAWSATVVASDGAGGRGLSAGIDGLVIVGYRLIGDEAVPRGWTSIDGRHWLAFRPNTALGRMPTQMDVVAPTEGGHVAVSGTGDAWISLDQGLWLNRPAFDAGPADAVRAVAAAGDILVAGGRSTAGRPTFWVGSLALQLPTR